MEVGRLFNTGKAKSNGQEQRGGGVFGELEGTLSSRLWAEPGLSISKARLGRALWLPYKAAFRTHLIGSKLEFVFWKHRR